MILIWFAYDCRQSGDRGGQQSSATDGSIGDGQADEDEEAADGVIGKDDLGESSKHGVQQFERKPDGPNIFGVEPMLKKPAFTQQSENGLAAYVHALQRPVRLLTTER